MSHRKIAELIGPDGNYHPARMEPDVAYQLRGWSCVMLHEEFGHVTITLYSYDSPICRWDSRDGGVHDMYPFDNVYNISRTTTSHLSKFHQFLIRSVKMTGEPIIDPDTYNCLRAHRHTPNEWRFIGFSGDYDTKPFWW